MRKLFGLPEQLKKGDGTQDKFKALFEQIDTDGSGKLTLKEFTAAFVDGQAPDGAQQL